MLDRYFRPDVLRLHGDYSSQYYAVQELVRPWEVEHLINCSAPREVVVQLPPFAEQIAWWLRSSFANRQLVYQADPHGFLDYWYAPGATLRRGKGDCEDFTLLAVSMLMVGGVHAEVAIGTLWTGNSEGGHAWVEGADENGGFLIEATTGELYRYRRPSEYRLQCKIAPESSRRAA